MIEKYRSERRQQLQNQEYNTGYVHKITAENLDLTSRLKFVEENHAIMRRTCGSKLVTLMIESTAKMNDAERRHTALDIRQKNMDRREATLDAQQNMVKELLNKLGVFSQLDCDAYEHGLRNVVVSEELRIAKEKANTAMAKVDEVERKERFVDHMVTVLKSVRFDD